MLAHPVRRCPRNGKRDKSGIGHCACAWEGAGREHRPQIARCSARKPGDRPWRAVGCDAAGIARRRACLFRIARHVHLPFASPPPFPVGRAGVRAGEPRCNRALPVSASPHSHSPSRRRSRGRNTTMRKTSTTWWSPPPAPRSPPMPRWPRSKSSTARNSMPAARVRCRNCCAAVPASPSSTRAAWASSAPCSCAAPNPTTPCSWSMACASVRPPPA